MLPLGLPICLFPLFTLVVPPYIACCIHFPGDKDGEKKEKGDKIESSNGITSSTTPPGRAKPPPPTRPKPPPVAPKPKPSLPAAPKPTPAARTSGPSTGGLRVTGMLVLCYDIFGVVHREIYGNSLSLLRLYKKFILYPFLLQ